MHKEFDKIKDDIPTEDELLELIDKKSIFFTSIYNKNQNYCNDFL